MEKFTSILKRPYPYYIPFNRSFKMILAGSILLPLFFILIKPFNLGLWNCPYKNLLIMGMFLPIFTALSINFYGLAKIFPKFFNEDSWTIGKETLWSVWNISAILVFNAAYWEINTVCDTAIENFGSYFISSFIFAFFPMLLCISYNQLWSLKSRLRKVETLNKTLKARNGMTDDEIIEIHGENENEVCKVGVDHLLLIESNDNYSKVIWNGEDNIKYRLVRSSLKRVSGQIPYPYIKRCHRSYIVNLLKVRSVAGNARGYKLNVENYPNPIPVSRDHVKEVMTELSRLQE